MSNTYSLSERLRSVGAMWSEWAVCVGALAFTVTLSFFLTCFLMPGIVLILAWQLGAYYKNPNRRKYLRCVRIAPVVCTSLYISAFIMIAALVANRLLLNHPDYADSLNPEIPYISSLIIFPVTCLVSIFYATRKSRFGTSPCRHCALVMGVSTVNNVMSEIFLVRAKGQITLLAWLSGMMTVVDWVYYWLIYVNVNFNSPDTYFYFAFPIIVYVLSLVYLRRQYSALSVELRIAAQQSEAAENQGDGNVLRFLVINGDSILVREREHADNRMNMCLDTPAIVRLPLDVAVTDERAAEEFRKLSGQDGFTVRRLFTNKSVDGMSTTYHFAVILNDATPLPENWSLGKNWMTISEIDMSMRAGVLSADMSEEVYIVYTITMAWKTYDSRGFRLYPVRNYKPTFRLRDLRNWDVDYNDRHWLDVARFNEDMRFFRLKRYFRNLFCHKS